MTLPLDASFACDVAIVGAGPAGAMAACELGHAGLRTALIDKAAPPRYKVCGGGLVHRGRRLLPFEPTGAIEVECQQINLYHNAYRSRSHAQRDAPLVTMVMRDRFDHALVQHAQALGVTLLAGEAVTALERLVGQTVLTTGQRRVVAQAVIAADGAISPTAKLLGWTDDRVLMPALECEVWVGEADFARLKGDARFDLDAIPHGYGWSFPKRDHLSLGVCLLHKERDKAQLRQHYQAYRRSLGIAHVVREDLHGYVIPVGLRQRVAQGSVLLAGDAAGTADPLTAEGISNALLTGQWAAQALLEQRGADGRIGLDAACAQYQRRVDTDLRPQLLASQRLADFQYGGNAFLRNLLMKRFGQQLADRVADVFMGTKGYPLNVQASIWRRLRQTVST